MQLPDEFLRGVHRRGAAAGGAVRRRGLLPAPGGGAPARARAAARRHRRGGGAARRHLARHPGREGLRRDHRQLVRALHQAARGGGVGRPRRGPGRVRAQALRDPPRRRAGRRPGPRHPVVLEPHDRLQGHAHGAAAAGLLPRPAGRADEGRAGARPLALLHQHLPELGARAPVPDDRPQRRDQHAARQRQLDARARVAAALRAVRRRPREGAAGRPPGRLGLGDVRQRARAARARRPQPPARADDDGAGGVGGARRPARPPAGVLRVPLVPDGAVGRTGGDLLHGRPRDRRDARPQRAPAGSLDGDEGRLGRARLGVRRARRAGRERAAARPPRSRASCSWSTSTRAGSSRTTRSRSASPAAGRTASGTRTASSGSRTCPTARAGSRASRCGPASSRSATRRRTCGSCSRRWRPRARSRSARWATTSRSRSSPTRRRRCSRTSSSCSRRSRTRRSTRSASRS